MIPFSVPADVRSTACHLVEDLHLIPHIFCTSYHIKSISDGNRISISDGNKVADQEQGQEQATFQKSDCVYRCNFVRIFIQKGNL